MPDVDGIPYEDECQRTIVDAAKTTGWLVHHTRKARGKHETKWRTPIQGHVGFPDLVLVHPTAHRVMIVELKRRPAKPTLAQAQWIEAFIRAGITARVVWVPDELHSFVQELADKAAKIADPYEVAS